MDRRKKNGFNKQLNNNNNNNNDNDIENHSNVM